MNPSINLLSGFKKIKGEEGLEHFAGTLNLKAIKRLSDGEIEVVLLPATALPKSLMELMKKAGNVPDLLMFSENSPGKQD